MAIDKKTERLLRTLERMTAQWDDMGNGKMVFAAEVADAVGEVVQDFRDEDEA